MRNRTTSSANIQIVCYILIFIKINHDELSKLIIGKLSIQYSFVGVHDDEHWQKVSKVG